MDIYWIPVICTLYFICLAIGTLCKGWDIIIALLLVGKWKFIQTKLFPKYAWITSGRFKRGTQVRLTCCCSPLGPLRRFHVSSWAGLWLSDLWWIISLLGSPLRSSHSAAFHMLVGEGWVSTFLKLTSVWEWMASASGFGVQGILRFLKN